MQISGDPVNLFKIMSNCRTKNRLGFCQTPRILALIALVCVSSMLASAGPITIFSSFGPGQTVDDTNSYCVYGSSVASNCGTFTSALAPAFAFMSTGSYAVSQIDLSLNWYQGTDSAIVSLFTDVGDTPGTLLGSWAVSGQQDLPDPPLTTIVGITGVTLVNGAGYFIQVSPGGATTEDGWVLGPFAGGVFYEPGSVASGDIERLPAFDLLGNAIPEPTTAALLAFGLVALFAWLRSRRQTV
jgi:hypothetical protein